MALILGALLLVVVLIGAATWAVLGRDRGSDTPEPTPSAAGSDAPSGSASPGSSSTGSASTGPASSSRAPSTGSAGGGAYASPDGSLAEPFRSAVPAGFQDMLRKCREGTVTITTYGTGADKDERQAPGMTCMGISGTPVYGHVIEFVNEEQWAKDSIEKAKSMDHEVVRDAGGIFVAVAWFSENSNKVYFSSTDKNVALEVYSFDTKQEALDLARQLAG